MTLGRQTAVSTFTLGLFLAGLSGCMGLRNGSSQAREENRKLDCLERCGDELAAKQARPILARSQAPEVLPAVRIGTADTDGRAKIGDSRDVRRPANEPLELPLPPDLPGRVVLEEPLPPTTLVQPADIKAPPVVAPIPTALEPTPTLQPVASKKNAAPAGEQVEGDTQVRIVASIGNNPIYESEIREAVYQRLGELVRLSETARQAKEKEIFREELKRIIERELVLDDMNAHFTAKKMTNALSRLKESAAKEATTRLSAFKRERGIATDEEFRTVLRSQGLTLGGIRRQIERGTMMQIYLRERVTRTDSVSLQDIREFYDKHPNDFKAEDRVVWQDIFVLNDKFASAQEARRYAETLAAKATKSEDFAKLASEFSQGDSKSRNGAGIGETPGEIFPQELEPTILALKAGQITLKPTENGVHILRVAERTYAGRQPFTEALQAEIRSKIQQQIFDRDAKRLIDTLWKRVQPQIWIEL